MTAKESQENKTVDENLEKILSHAKDISSYLDNINDNIAEILAFIQDYDCPKDKVYTYELGENDEEYW
jgi:hypothetical protein